MGLNNISRGFGHGIGKFVETTRKVLSWPGGALSKVIEKLRFVFPDARARVILTEELIHLMDAQGLAGEKLEQRLQVMAETILALQERLDELVARGHISETDMLEAVDSLKAADSFTNNERAMLVKVFRQNIAIQRPELVGADID